MYLFPSMKTMQWMQLYLLSLEPLLKSSNECTTVRQTIRTGCYAPGQKIGPISRLTLRRKCNVIYKVTECWVGLY